MANHILGTARSSLNVLTPEWLKYRVHVGKQRAGGHEAGAQSMSVLQTRYSILILLEGGMEGSVPGKIKQDFIKERSLIFLVKWWFSPRTDIGMLPSNPILYLYSLPDTSWLLHAEPLRWAMLVDCLPTLQISLPLAHVSPFFFGSLFYNQLSSPTIKPPPQLILVSQAQIPLKHPKFLDVIG